MSVWRAVQRPSRRSAPGVRLPFSGSGGLCGVTGAAKGRDGHTPMPTAEGERYPVAGHGNREKRGAKREGRPATNLNVPSGRARDCRGLSGPTLPPVRVGAALVDELLDGVEDAPDTRFVRAFEELPAERVKLVEFVLALIVALVLHGRSPGCVPTASSG